MDGMRFPCINLSCENQMNDTEYQRDMRCIRHHITDSVSKGQGV